MKGCKHGYFGRQTFAFKLLHVLFEFALSRLKPYLCFLSTFRSVERQNCRSQSDCEIGNHRLFIENAEIYQKQAVNLCIYMCTTFEIAPKCVLGC